MQHEHPREAPSRRRGRSRRIRPDRGRARDADLRHAPVRRWRSSSSRTSARRRARAPGSGRSAAPVADDPEQGRRPMRASTGLGRLVVVEDSGRRTRSSDARHDRRDAAVRSGDRHRTPTRCRRPDRPPSAPAGAPGHLHRRHPAAADHRPSDADDRGRVPVRKLICTSASTVTRSGVTLVIVALCLIALFGMLVLVVDVGGLLLNRRAMVNASDAAALVGGEVVRPASVDGSTDGRAGGRRVGRRQLRRVPTDRTGDQHHADARVRHEPIRLRDRAVRREPAALLRRDLRAGRKAMSRRRQPRSGARRAAATRCRSSSTSSRSRTASSTTIDPTKTCYVWEDNSNIERGAERVRSAGSSDRRSHEVRLELGPRASHARTRVGDRPVDQQLPRPVNRRPAVELSEPDLRLPRRAVTSAEHVELTSRKLKGQTLDCSRSTGATTTLPGNPGGQLLTGSTNEASCPQTPGPVRHHRVLRGEARRALHDQPSAANGSCGTASTVRFPGSSNRRSTSTRSASLQRCFDGRRPTASPRPSDDTVDPRQARNQVRSWARHVCRRRHRGLVDYCYNSTDPVRHVEPERSCRRGPDYDVIFDWSTGGPCGYPPRATTRVTAWSCSRSRSQIGGIHPGTAASPDSNVRAVQALRSDDRGLMQPRQRAESLSNSAGSSGRPPTRPNRLTRKEKGR